MNCSHECKCSCHTNDSTRHVRACCEWCSLCKKNVKVLKDHMNQCHTLDNGRERIVPRISGKK